MSLEDTKKWFEQAIPEPTIETACVQIGCHLEEVAEMMSALGYGGFAHQINKHADSFKKKHRIPMKCLSRVDKVELLDSLADQTVTACGVSHTLGMDHLGALNEVNRSNFSKFENGYPVFNDKGKIDKGVDYTPPNLKPYI